MKKIKTLIIATLIGLNAKAQTPPFPSIDAAFAKVVIANYEQPIFQETALHANQFKLLPKKEVKEWNEKYSEESSYFSAYPSERCKDLYWAAKPNYPDDECHVFFSANSPKVGNEEYKSIIFEVVYTRLKNSVLTNNWEFKYVDFGGSYTFNRKGLDGKLILAEVEKALMQTKSVFSKIDYETVNINGNEYHFGVSFRDFTSIDSITFDKEGNSNDTYNLNFYGHFQTYEYGDECLPTYSGTKKLVSRVSMTINGGKVVETYFRDGYGSKDLTSEEKPKEGFKNAEELTFAQLYKKPKQPKCESAPGVAFKYEAPEDRKAKFVECIKTVMADGKQLTNPKKMKEFMVPNDNTSYDKFVALFKALEDQGYGWRNFREENGYFKYEIFGRKLLNKMYKEEKNMYYDPQEIKNVIYFGLRP